MQKYKVTLILTADEFIEMVQQRLGPSNTLKVEKVVDKPEGKAPGVRLDPSAMSASRGKRKSKVVETILSTLQDGQASAAKLRSALAHEGMSESSLSTGLAILQKSGQIRRDTAGDYYLAAHEGAEAA